LALICAPGADAGLLLTNFPPRGWLDTTRCARPAPT
jgi:2-methylfumaryl-CoA isomerase